MATLTATLDLPVAAFTVRDARALPPDRETMDALADALRRPPSAEDAGERATT